MGMDSFFSVAPRIDRSSVQDIKVRAGQPFDMQIPVSGEPPPTVAWSFMEKSLETTDRVKLENKEYITKINVKRALRSDTGMYTVTATNESGTDKVEFNVTVLGKV